MSGDADIATKRLRLKIALEELREMKGFGTELVTIIIPPDRQFQMLEYAPNDMARLISSQKALERMSKVQLNPLSRH